MKKKRKKNVTIYSLSPSETFPLSNPSLQLLSTLISAPDVPNGYDCGVEEQNCLKFYEDLFGVVSVKESSDVSLRVFVRQLAEKVIVSWCTVQVGEKLYIRVPLNASKESFIALLDHAEEHLAVAEVIACADRRHQNHNSTVKAFQFMGFETIEPGTAIEAYNISPKAHFLCLGYEVD